MKKNKKKVTKNEVCSILDRITQWQSEVYYKTAEVPEVHGIVFSNEGSKGRPALFDASENETKDIFAYLLDEDKGIIEISAPEPGYEIKAPESLENYFARPGLYNQKRKLIQGLTYLDVSHLDVSQSTNFFACFEKYGYFESSPAELKGLETWDVSQGEDFSYMFRHAFPQNENIFLNLSSWRFTQKTRIRFQNMFQDFGKQADKVFLNVSGWNTTNVYSFDLMFDSFAPHAKTVELKGVEDWRLGTGVILLGYVFYNFAVESSCHLDLSKWSANCSEKPIMKGFAEGTFSRIQEPA